MNQLCYYSWFLENTIPYFSHLWQFILQDFLGLVEKFFYLSGRYDIELTVGDAVMVSFAFLSQSLSICIFFDSPSKFVVFQENSFLRAVGHVELDLPEAPEKAPRPPPLAVDPSSRYGPKAEITHIFRAPEKRPPQELALAFLGLTLLPLVGFLIGVSFFLLRILNKLFLIVISCSQTLVGQLKLVWPIVKLYRTN